MIEHQPLPYHVNLSLHPVPEISSWIWGLEEARKRTNEELDLLTPSMIDWQPPHGDSTIGSVLYHIALIEADWLYAEVLEQDYPETVQALLPYDHRNSKGELTHVPGLSLSEHRERLDIVRQLLLEVFQSMDLADFRRGRHLPNYIVTPEWVLFHLMQHEAEHRSQIGGLRIAAERAQQA